MSLVYYNAPAFVAGQEITAESASLLAEAFNSRLRGGVGDPTRRIWTYGFYNWMQVQNPSEDAGLPGTNRWPSKGEFSMYYQNLDFDKTPGTWPIAGRGDYEGSNTACPGMQFVHGLIGPTGDILFDGEGERTEKFGGIFDPGGPPEYNWILAKYQRGGYDPTNGNQYWPMGELAQSHSMITTPYWSKHLKTPGGYLPVPRSGYPEICTDNVDIYFPNWQFKWTKIDPPYTVVLFNGICGPSYGGTEEDVSYVHNGPFSWTIYQFNGNVTKLLKSDYVEGPYDGGGYLQRGFGDQINHLMLAPFISSFKGTEQQQVKSECYNIDAVSFTSQEFFESQYLLAPHYATTVGDELVVSEPNYNFGTAGVDLKIDVGTTSATHAVPAGFVCGGFLAWSNGLAGTASIQQISASVVVHQFDLTGSISTIKCFTTQSLREVSYRLSTDAYFTASNGAIYIESLDLADYKPQLHDAYAIIRMSTARGSMDDDSMDQRGKDEYYSRNIYQNYISSSAFLNLNGAAGVYQQQAAVNTNPVYDASREFISKYTKTINGHDLMIPDRKMCIGYEISASVSVLYFNRYQAGLGLTTNNLDMFNGLVNPDDSSEEGIHHIPHTASFTNEWLMFMQSKPYNPSDSSLWKRGNYADYFPTINRCLFAPGYRSRFYNQELWQFFNEMHPDAPYDLRKLYYFPETAFTAYNYDGGAAGGVNPVSLNYDPEDPGTSEWASNFYKSCPIYPRDYEVESVKVIVENGEEIVRVAFTTRLQHCDTAPNSISRDTSTWNIPALNNEPYRTDENAIRQYILQNDDSYNPLQKVGDSQCISEVYQNTDRPYGSVMPTFFFTKLIPKPYIPPKLETSCSACFNTSSAFIPSENYQQMVYYLKGMCEGFVDDATSTTYGCQTWYDTAFDYTYENLIYDASGGTFNSIPILPTNKRPDKPYSYGPLPNLNVAAQPINLIANAVNKLTKARLPMPWQLLVKASNYESPEDAVTADVGGSCGGRAIKFDYAAPDATILVQEGDWSPASGVSSAIFGGMKLYYPDGSSCADVKCSGGDWVMGSQKSISQYSFQLIDPLSYYAISDEIANLLTTAGAAGFFGYYENHVYTSTAESYTPVEEDGFKYYDNSTNCGSIYGFWDLGDDGVYKWTYDDAVTTGCGFYINGTLDAGSPPSGDNGMGMGDSGNVECGRASCAIGTGRSLSITVKNTTSIILNIPTITAP